MTHRFEIWDAPSQTPDSLFVTLTFVMPMKRLLLLAAFAAPVPALAQSAADDWAAAYRLVLVRDWPAADSALAAFTGRHSDDANAPRAAFWACYVAEQRSRLDEAADCYGREAEAGRDARWQAEARARLVSLNLRRAQQGGTLGLRLPTNVGTETYVTSSQQDGTTRVYVVQKRPDGTLDTLTNTFAPAVCDDDCREALADAEEALRDAQEAAREAQQEAQHAVRVAQEAMRNAQRAAAEDRAAAQQEVAEAQREATALQREAAEAQRAVFEAQRALMEAQRNGTAHRLSGVAGQAARAYGSGWTSAPVPPVPPMPPAVACSGGDCSAWSAAWSGQGRAADTLSANERVAVMAVDALGRQGNAEAVPDLRGLAISGTSVPVRIAALGALARIGTPEALRVVVDAARPGVLPVSTYEALVQALSRVGQRSPDAPGLVAALDRIGRMPGVRVGAIQALSRVNTAEATDALYRLAADASLDAEKRIAALRYLAQRDDADASRLMPLVEGLARTDPEDGVQVLAYLQGRPATEAAATTALERLAGGASGPGRVPAVMALVRRPTDRTVPLLARLAAGPDRDVSEVAVQALARLDTDEARRALLALARRAQ